MAFKTFGPAENLNLRCSARKINKTNTNIRGGYWWKLSSKSPLISATKDLCMPQPGHSIPKYFLYKQGNIAC